MGNKNTDGARPFLKWAGGKNQLLSELEKRIPPHMVESKVIENYIEPFVGGGAFFFFLANNYEIKKATLIDINRELILCYKVIQTNYQELIENLNILQEIYYSIKQENRNEYYYEKRTEYNKALSKFDFNNYNDNWIERASLMIFLNKTCFNGLTRQNRKGEFNVPYGKYKNPTICDEKNIMLVHKALKNVGIYQGEFDLIKEIPNNKDTFVYFDPPYRPLSTTSSFTNYTKDRFDDSDQLRLRHYYGELAKQGAYLLLSNSDPKNIDPNDEFFDMLYQEYTIERVEASRMINCVPSKRGKIKELIITNYTYNSTSASYENIQ